MDHFVSLMDNATNKPKFAALGLNDVCQRVRGYNQAFQRAYLAQVNANADIRQQGTASEKRKNLEVAMRNFYALVDPMKNIAPWSTLYPKLEELQMRTKH
jgi:hypothetical protein